jgi:hypothetical protein
MQLVANPPPLDQRVNLVQQLRNLLHLIDDHGIALRGSGDTGSDAFLTEETVVGYEPAVHICEEEIVRTSRRESFR